MESDARFYRRRANEELAAAQRAVTRAARERRLQLAGAFLQHLQASEARALIIEAGITDPSMFKWAEKRIKQNA